MALKKSHDKMIAGVCGGLSQFFGISSFWFRLAFLIALIPGGVPSTTQPMAGPWLSPQVVTRNRCPKVFIDMGSPGAGLWRCPAGSSLSRLRQKQRAPDQLPHHKAGAGAVWRGTEDVLVARADSLQECRTSGRSPKRSRPIWWLSAIAIRARFRDGGPVRRSPISAITSTAAF